MKICKCKGNVVDLFGKVLFRDGDICAATWAGSSWEVYGTEEINGKRYVDARDNGRRLSEKMFQNHFE